MPAPAIQDLESFQKGKELFRNGLLTEARLAFEAEVQRNPGNVDAWRLLGTVHAENDNDPQVRDISVTERCGITFLQKSLLLASSRNLCARACPKLALWAKRHLQSF